jgi:NAD(P)-dependent dehydrogenase (short-subunit alcohol dehydrogenase family)
VSRRVAVTGAASGIGFATAALLEARGAEVIRLDVNQPHDVYVDLADPESIDTALTRIGPIDALCNIAGISGDGGPEPTMRVNYLGLRHLTTALVAANEGLAIACAASFRGAAWRERLPLHLELAGKSAFGDGLSWVRAHADQIDPDPYAWSKEALIVWIFVASASPEWRSRGVRINGVAPGPIDTPLIAGFLESVPEIVQVDIDRAGRIGQPEDIAGPLAFLVSEDAGFVNGVVLPTDGGLAATFAVE